MENINDLSVYDIRTNARKNPMVTDRTPVFSWKTKTEKRGARQNAYRIVVAEDKDLLAVVWDSQKVLSCDSIGILYKGAPLLPMTRYYWQVTLWNEEDIQYTSDTAFFETGLMDPSKNAWNGAEWITAPVKTENTAELDKYSVEADFKIEEGNQACFVIAARNKDNYTLIAIDTFAGMVRAFNHYDDTLEREHRGAKEYGYLFSISDEVIPIGTENEYHHAKITVDGRLTSLDIDGMSVFKRISLLPKEIPNNPKKAKMLSVGFYQRKSKAAYRNMKITDLSIDSVYCFDDFSSNDGLLSALGEVKDGEMVVCDRFEIVCPVPAVTVKKDFLTEGKIKSARLYSTARGFYDAYLNGERVNTSYYDPGFTDYRVSMHYQTFDVGDMLKQGKNIIGAIVGKGYWSGYCGYSGAQIYGKQNAFLCKLVINYEDGTKQVIITDRSWKYTPKTPVQEADYLDGENYDARLELGNWENENGWVSCGVQEWPQDVLPTNGELDNVPFTLTAKECTEARIEQVLTPVNEIAKPDRGYFIYDFGQNIVGTIRLKVKGRRGLSLKLRYGEMCDKRDRLYTANLRTAVNTDVYTLRGDEDGEVFVPTFTSHGFRYVEITGNGFWLKHADMIVSVEGLVMNNLSGVTGNFECSNEDINRLQSNIRWGQRGNSLLVLTDCPQRNERMGWTGDAQVFARTGAYNMEMQAFARKWLRDLREAQLMYNKKGAVPDTAPLGGDNRPDGCDGWGDAAVIVPWEMYMAYGDKAILEENYDMMKKWVEYQSLPERQNYGVRIIDGMQRPEQSDLANIPYIQVQQRRGDHLAQDITTPYILSATAYAAHSADILSRVARILEKYEDEKKYRKRFENIKKAFNQAWIEPEGSISYWGEMSLSVDKKAHWEGAGLDKDGRSINETYYSDLPGSVSHPSQTAYALTIMFDLIDKDKIPAAAMFLKKAIERNNGLISAGFLGISHVAPALQKGGLAKEAVKLLEQTKNPSWLYSVQNGATTIWERWDSYIAETGKFGNVSMNSFNHYSYGSIGEWMFGGIAGINAGEPGYKHILLAPNFGGTLTHASAWHESPYGRIESAWRTENGKFIYNCLIPPNTTATLCLPSKNGGERHELVSGRYEFVTEIEPNR